MNYTVESLAFNPQGEFYGKKREILFFQFIVHDFPWVMGG